MPDSPQTQFNSPWTVANMEALFNDCSAAKLTYESLTACITAAFNQISGKQAALTTEQLAAVNSGITEAIVTSLTAIPSIPQSSDLNSYTTAGFAYSPNGTRSSSLYHCPWTSTGFGLQVIPISPSNCCQIIRPHSTSNAGIFLMRYQVAGTFQSWYKYTGEAVSDSGAPPA